MQPKHRYSVKTPTTNKATYEIIQNNKTISVNHSSYKTSVRTADPQQGKMPTLLKEVSTSRPQHALKQSVQTHLLLLRLMTLSLCMSPISSGKDSNLLECKKSTVAFFQLPIYKGKEAKNRKLWANQLSTDLKVSMILHDLPCVCSPQGAAEQGSCDLQRRCECWHTGRWKRARLQSHWNCSRAHPGMSAWSRKKRRRLLIIWRCNYT